MKYIEPLSRLIAAFSKLPSVGEKTAARYAYAVLNSTDEDVKELAEAIATLKENVHFCSVCGNFTEHDVCDICSTRSPKTICVVKEPRDITALEKVKDFKGVYHVLHGVISPMEKIFVFLILESELWQIIKRKSMRIWCCLQRFVRPAKF